MKRRRFVATAVGATVALLVALLPTVFVPAGAATGDPEHVQINLEGCRNPAGPNDPVVNLPNGSGDFICPDENYTSGNLGKGWNELDLVPYRIETSVGTQASATTDYVVVIVLDSEDAGKPGYDAISVPKVNAALSDSSCSVTSDPPATDLDGAELTPGVGGTAVSIYRELTIHQDKGTTCVFDYYGRLALGSHLYPGASLHANLLNQSFETGGVGAQDVSIPVNEIKPQELNKDMSATQNANHTWNVTKSPSPASLTFADTCSTVAADRQANVSVTVSWEKLAANPTGYTVTTNIYATNPAHRTITVSVTDSIRSGTTEIHSASFGPTDVAANTTLLIGTHTQSFAANAVSNPPNFNDIATATYTDKVTGITVPGTTTATASVANANIGQGTVTNGSATVTDSESITGNGLDFKVATPSVGNFTGGYVAGTWTTGPVGWSSGSVTGNGSVTFNKTVRAAVGTTTSSGSLADTATLTGSNGFSASANLSIGITSDASVKLTVSKTITATFQTARSFTFRVKQAGVQVGTTTITIPAGSLGPVTGDITGLDQGVLYTLHEDASAPYPARDLGSFTITSPSCSLTSEVENDAAPASARVRKITAPTGTTSWSFTLTGPGGLSETKSATAGAGYVAFAADLDVDGGVYTITESAKSGWDPTGIVGDVSGDSARVSTNTTSRTCSFTYNAVTDSGSVLSCTFTNTQRGTIIVEKQTNPDGATGSFTFTGTAAGTISDNGTITVTDLVPGTYTSTEGDPTPNFDLTGISCDDGASATPSTYNVGTRTATFKLDPGETVKCTFTNTKRGTITIDKTVSRSPITGSESFQFQLRQNASTASNGTVLDTKYANSTNGGDFTFSVNGTTKLVPGSYQVCEFIQVGWDSTLQLMAGAFVPGTGGDTQADNTYVCVPVTLAAGEDETLTIDNTPPPGGMAKTIGFWKNHASCKSSNGNQDAVLDQWLAAGGAILIGDLSISTCEVAVDILDKREVGVASVVGDGKKKASDPAFNLAAQLLAYRLNIRAGADSTCTPANTAAANAQAALDAINFDGNDHANISKTLAATLNGYAATLDSYNNNTLC